MSGLVQTTAPTVQPVTLAEAKAWLRVRDSDTSEDVLIVALIDAARAYVENFTRRALISQGFELSLDNFPGRDLPLSQLSRLPEVRNAGPVLQAWRNGEMGNGYLEITLPRPPLISVASVKYYDSAGALQTMDAAQYFVDTRTQPGRIVLNPDYDWPDTQLRPNAVIIAYTAGYGTSSQVPGGLRTAMRFMIAHFFENRAPVETGLRAAAVEIPMSVEALLWQHRIPTVY